MEKLARGSDSTDIGNKIWDFFKWYYTTRPMVPLEFLKHRAIMLTMFLFSSIPIL
jgi:hypothetical protein